MNSVVEFVADDEVVLTATGGLKCLIIGFESGLFMLGLTNVLRAEVACFIESFATLKEVQLIFVELLNVAYKDMLANAPILNKLNKGYIPAVAQSTNHQAKAGTCLPFAIAGVHNNHRLFSLKILKAHAAILLPKSLNPSNFRSSTLLEF